MTTPTSSMPASDTPSPTRGSVAEVATSFLTLGLTSFGGPIAHLGYFHREFVERRRWLDGERFGQLLALCQFLPGPASSQLGFLIGGMRAGWAGALAAFAAFTLPSALLMFGFSLLSVHLGGVWGQGTVHGLGLVAVAVVAQGILAMMKRLTPDRNRALIAVSAAIVVLLARNAAVQLLVIAVAAALGPWLCKNIRASGAHGFSLPYGRRTGAALLCIYALLLVAAWLLPQRLPPAGQAAAAFYRSGALVFGGGHVVLPLLKHALVDPGWIDDGTFLTGYGAAQAVPGPMFSVAAFLGERLSGGHGGAASAFLCLLAIFMPGFLLVSGTLPFWHALSSRPGAARMLAAINAAVVGLLMAAFYDPVWLGAVHDVVDVAIALVAFAWLVFARGPAIAVVAWCVLASMLRMALSL